MLNPFSLTSEQFSDLIKERLKKGKGHALSLYKELYRKGEMKGEDPSFKNAEALKTQILTSTDYFLPTMRKGVKSGKTQKFILELKDGYECESVLIPMEAGWTLCISSQIGCQMGCRFCETGRMGLKRNLTADEIVIQVWWAIHRLKYPVRSIVFMGMGEPMDNIRAVTQAIKILNDPQGFYFGLRNITVSTSGHLEGMKEFLNAFTFPPHLAVSVIAPNDTLRTRLMPVNRRWNLEELKEMMLQYCLRFKRSILFEYIMIEGVNDSPEDALELIKYLKGIEGKINLIPYNPQSSKASPLYDPTLTFKPSTATVCQSFANILRSHGRRALFRSTKGDQIMAACGQLGNLKHKLKKNSNPTFSNKVNI